MNCPGCGSLVDETASSCGHCRADVRLTAIGADGGTYGPYTVSQLRQYVSHGGIPPDARLVDAQGNATTPASLGLSPAASAPVAPTPTLSTPTVPSPLPPVPVPPGRGGMPPIPTPPPGYGAPMPPKQQSNSGKTCLLLGAGGCGCLVVVGIVLVVLLGGMFAKDNFIELCDMSLVDCHQAAVAYAADHNGMLPNADSWINDVGPYLEDVESTWCFETEGDYAFNRALSGANLASVADPASTPMISDLEYEAGLPGPHDGGWAVIFVDGHFEHVMP